LAAGQISLLQPTAGGFALIFYTWENVYRPWTYPSRLSRVYARIDRHVHRVSLGALCATQAAQEVLHRKGYRQATAVVPYGVRGEFFSERPAVRQADQPFTVGYIGRLLWMKGVDLLVHATARLAEAQLVLIGSGPDERTLRHLASDLQFENRVRIQPAVTEKDIVPWLASFDVLVLPSRTTPGWREQLGRVLIEAMALGVPAVGSSSGAIPEVLGREDLVFSEGNVNELVAILERVRTDESWRREICDYGRRRARERFSWGAFASAVGDFYRQLGLL
jgi:glycosyltransferase involved in cell wall biosynthesis